MPIDFKALMNKSPEERAADAEQARKSFEEDLQRVVAKRQADLAHIARAMQASESAFKNWDREFVGDLRRKAERTDRPWRDEPTFLFDLSSSQLSQIQRLTLIATRVLDSASEPTQRTNTGNERAAQRKGFRPR